MKTHKDFSWIFWLHLALIIAVYLSPILFPWKTIVFFTGLYYVQLFLLGACILSLVEFRSGSNPSFFHYYLGKMGFRLSRQTVRLFVDFVVPTVIIAISLLLQIKLRYDPLFAFHLTY